MRRLPLLFAPLLTASLVLAGCGGDKDEKKPETDPTETATSAAPATPPTSPLTGEVLKKAPKGPVIVTKIDNTASAAPQVGLKDADMVIEELVEGGYTRLAAAYWTKIPETAGPVRSMRASDINIVTPLGARIITSGAAAETIARIKDAGIEYVDENNKGLFRDSSRRMPYNLFARPKEIAAGLAQPDKAPTPYFAFGEASANPQGKPATSLTASFGSRSTAWSFEDGTWVNTNTFAGEDDQFEPANVVVLEVKLTDAGYKDPSGAMVPESHLLGTGNAWVFHNGRVVQGTWHKQKPASTITLKQGGKDLVVPVGKTFVELVPEGQGGVTFEP